MSLIKADKSERMKKYKMHEVYGFIGEMPLNYVERNTVDQVFKENYNRYKCISLLGRSKQGKTCLRKHCLKQEEYVVIQCSNKYSLTDLNYNILKKVGYEFRESFELSGHQHSGMNLEDVNDMLSALQDIQCDKTIVLEDFHYMECEVQKDFAVELKAFYENSGMRFLIIAAWEDANRLVEYNEDLSRRMLVINVDRWKNSDLVRVIRKGGALLNVEFREEFIRELLRKSSDVCCVQEACIRLCQQYHIIETQPQCVKIGKQEDAVRILLEM